MLVAILEQHRLPKQRGFHSRLQNMILLCRMEGQGDLVRRSILRIARVTMWLIGGY